MAAAHARHAPATAATPNDPAAILFSGGTTGLPKGIVLSNRNFIAEGMQARGLGRHGRERFDPRDPADLPRLRPRRVRERRVHGRRQVDPRAAVQRRDRGRSCCAASGPTCWWACRRCSTRCRKDPSLASADLSCLTRLLLRRRHAAAPGEGALRDAGRRARRPGEAARGLRPHRGGDAASWRCRSPSTAKARSASRFPTCWRRSAAGHDARRRRSARKARSASPGRR